MKLTVVCLALLFVACASASYKSSHRHHSRHSERSRSSRNYKFVQMNCPNGGRVEEEVFGPNEGVVAFTGTNDGSPCTFLLTGPAGLKTALDVTMRTDQPANDEDCSDGGELSIYSGTSSSAPSALQTCDKQNKKTLHISGNQAFINLTKDTHKTVLKILFRFSHSGARASSLDLFESWKRSGSKRHHHSDETESEEDHSAHEHHHHREN